MNVQFIYDNQGNPAGVFIPITDWQHLKRQCACLDNFATEENSKEQSDNEQQAINQAQKAYSVELIRQTHPAAYVPWTNEEEYRLKIMYFEAKSINEIAHTLGRKKGAILSRLRKLNISHIP